MVASGVRCYGGSDATPAFITEDEPERRVRISFLITILWVNKRQPWTGKLERRRRRGDQKEIGLRQTGGLRFLFFASFLFMILRENRHEEPSRKEHHEGDRYISLPATFSGEPDPK